MCLAAVFLGIGQCSPEMSSASVRATDWEVLVAGFLDDLEAQRRQLCVCGGPHRGRGEMNPAVLHLKTVRHPRVGSSVVRQVWVKPSLFGGLSLHGLSGMCTSSLARRLPGGIQAQGMRRRATQGLVLLLWGRTTARDPHALGNAQCGEQRGPDV